MKRIRTAILYGVLATFFLGALYAMTIIPVEVKPENPTPEAAAPLKRVDVLQVVPQPFEESILAPGVVEAEEDVTLGAVIPGILEKIYVKEGDEVKADQLLFQIDLRERSARLTEAESAHDLATKNLERLRSLFGKGNITRQELDDAVAREEQTAAARRRMDVEVSLGKIVAPVNGIIDRIDVDEGEYMREGDHLARLLRLDRVKIKVGVPERYADTINREKQAEVFFDALNESRTAVLDRVSFGGDTATNTYETLLRLENPDLRIRPGMIVKARMVTRRATDALLVPLFAIARSAQGMVVFVEKDTVVEERVVSLGSIQNDEIEISSGLEPHENIVVVGQKDLTTGQKVDVKQRLLQTPASIQLGTKDPS